VDGDEEKKKTDFLQKRWVGKKSKNFHTKVLGRIEPSPQPRRLPGPRIGPQVPPERPYMTNHLTTMPLYRNLVSTEISTNNKNVLLIVLLYCYSSTVPDGAQYLMGNLLRAGVDYNNNFSTTIPSTGITVFYAMATTSCKQVGGWDAVAGYLQTAEQFDIYAFLPTHAD
jgi:hypothetical protein